MTRILTVARSEFATLVKTKAFIIGILLMPVMMGGFIAFMNYAERHVDVETRPFAVIDGTGVLYDTVAREADAHNAAGLTDGVRTGPAFVPSRVDLGGRSVDDVSVELSERVRAKALFAFVVIPPTVVEAQAQLDIRYFAENSSYRPLRDWLEDILNKEIAARRFTAAGVDQALVERLTRATDVATFGLVERAPDGSVSPAREVDDLERVALPMFSLVLMFMCVMTGAMHLLNAVIEEKMSKISEVLIGSITPFQLLGGKLLGVVAVSLLLAGVYLAGGLYALGSFGRLDLFDPIVFLWFVVFLVCAALLFGAMFLAAGSACSNLKDAQALVQPAMMLMLVAYLASFAVMRAPDSRLAVGLSFFPTITPFAMIIRMSMPPGPPVWQLVIAVVLLAATTFAVVWAGSRIFRVGVLMQGKPPNLPELLKWIRR
jgi:ABC-2 type transport system permease protein